MLMCSSSPKAAFSTAWRNSDVLLDIFILMDFEMKNVVSCVLMNIISRSHFCAGCLVKPLMD